MMNDDYYDLPVGLDETAVDPETLPEWVDTDVKRSVASWKELRSEEATDGIDPDDSVHGSVVVSINEGSVNLKVSREQRRDPPQTSHLMVTKSSLRGYDTIDIHSVVLDPRHGNVPGSSYVSLRADEARRLRDLLTQKLEKVDVEGDGSGETESDGGPE